MQANMLMPVLRGEESQPYIQQFRWTIKDTLNWQEFKQTWKEVLRQHDALYFRYTLAKDGNVKATRHRHLQVSFSEEDWGRLSLKRKKNQLSAFLKADLASGFHTTQQPLCRVHYVRFGKSHHEIVFTNHHAVFDGRSRRLMMEELLALKDGALTSRDLKKKSTPAFADYLQWLNDQSWNKAKQFWKQQLAPIEEPTPFEFGYDRQPKQTTPQRKAYATTLFDPPQAKRTRQWSARHRLSINILAQGTWGILLSSFSRNEQVLFAAPRACRKLPIHNSESIVGVLINTVPVIAHVRGGDTVINYLNALKDYWHSVREHENTPLPLIKSSSVIPPQDPLFSTYVAYENYQLDDILPAGSKTKHRLSLTGFTEFPIALSIRDGRDLKLEVQYDESKYDRPTIRRLCTVFKTVFAQLIQDPSRKLREIQLLNKQEQRKILRVCQGKAPALSNLTIHETFEATAKKYPSAEALRFLGQTTSYRELNQQANQLARFLKRQGLKPGETVGLFFERNPWAIVSQIAVLKAGGIYVPLNTAHPSNRITAILNNARPRLILTQSNLRSSIQAGRRVLHFMDQLTAKLRRYSTENLNLKARANPAAYIMYTSGSTGAPKGVVVPQAGIVRLVKRVTYAKLNRQTRSLQLTSLSFDLSTFEIWGALLNGGSCILYPGEDPQLAKLKQIIRKEKINTVLLSASVFNVIVNEDPHVLKGVFQLVIGAEALSPSHVAKALKLLPKLQLINGYGPTEASALNNCYSIPKNQPADRSVPIGKPIAHSSSYILDKENRLLPVGVPGELHLSGIGLASGYHRNQNQTREKFIRNPLTTGKETTLYKTGDRCFMHAGGDLDFLERFDDQLKIRGHRIEPAEIRSHILNIPGCKDCRVMAVKNKRGEDELRAFTVLKGGTKLTAQEIKETLQSVLPYYMIPAHVVFLNSLPLNPNGKVDRKVLSNIDVSSSRAKSGHSKITSATEKTLASIWKEILGESPQTPDIDFFEAGGHSLLATSLIFRIQQQFNSRIPFTVFETHSTLRSLTAWIDREKRSRQRNDGIKPLVLSSLNLKDRTPLGLKWRTFCIPDIRRPDEVHSLLITRAVVLEGNLRPALLGQAMQQVINANERLRTCGIVSNDQLLEKVEPHLSFNLPVKDLTHLTENQAMSIASGIFRKESLASMNMRYAPQLRVQLLKVAKRKYFLSLVIQHAVADGHAVEMFYQQTSKAYNRLVSGNTKTLKAPEFSYREYESQLEDWLADGNEERIKTFWKKELRGIRPIPYPFLVKKVPKKIDWNQFDHYWFPSRWHKKIKAFCREHKITTFVFFSTLVKLLVARYTGLLDSYYTSAVNGRTGHQQEPIFGDFACTILVRSKLDPDKSFVQLAEAESAKLFTCLDHKQISVNGIDAPHKKQVAHPHSPFGQLQVIEGADTGESLQLKGVKSKFIMRTRSGALARLGFVTRETSNSLQITFAYAPMIFLPHSIDRLKFNFQSFIKLILQNPTLTLAQLPNLNIPSAYRKSLSKSEREAFILKDSPA